MWKAGNAPWTQAQRREAAAGPTRRVAKRRQRPLSSEQVQKLITGYRQGLPVNDLAAQFDVHRDTVFEHLKRQQVRRRRPPLDFSQIEETVQLYQGGSSVAMLAEKFEVSPTTILRTLHREGVPVRDRHWRES